MIRAVIIDDEIGAINVIKELLDNIPDVKVIGQAQNVPAGVDEIVKHKPDLIFLDIEMRENNGFELLDQLKDIQFTPRVIFTTAHDQAVQAFDYGAFDYLLKPIHPNRLKKAVQRLQLEINEPSSPSNRLSFSTGKGRIWINPDEVLGCTANGNYTDIFLTSGKKVSIIEQIGKLHKKLGDRFVRCHRSAILNSGFINELDTYNMQVVVGVGEKTLRLPLSREGLQRIKNKIH